MILLSPYYTSNLYELEIARKITINSIKNVSYQILLLQKQGGVASEPFRLPQDHEMFTRLQHLIITGK